MDINELEVWFNNTNLPSEIILNGHTKIKNVDRMVKTHIAYLRNNSGNLNYMPYYERLLLVKELIEGAGKRN